MTAVWLEHCS